MVVWFQYRRFSFARLQYRRDAEAAYQQKLLDAYMGKGEFPKIRTFNKYDTSTNSVFQDLEAAEQMYIHFFISFLILKWCYLVSCSSELSVEMNIISFF